ncbi:DUF29 domain-containing protein [Leptolyngbya sp. CCNP1308]|uniref:DUF29 domain-containing protein n=1 Tax=Leptolyngbya sp. CCNP1308 TaxID=3110255 RepID=UPI002B1EE35D|nr:DUF29 domain-containing protein [Leptolyngbya sp. CCNP1308]MEA5448970.1 DUF29 domain-containing protein [Leptolyngbya sp. CCNP1308]
MTPQAADSTTQVNTPSLYDTDFLLWIENTVACLQARKFENLDLENLIEEIDSLGRSDKRAVSSYLMRLCEHLLKMAFWDSERANCFRGWDSEIANFRAQVQEQLDTSPSLRPWLEKDFLKQYKLGRKLFLKSSGLAADVVPENPFFSLDQALEEDWLPPLNSLE